MGWPAVSRLKSHRKPSGILVQKIYVEGKQYKDEEALERVF
jgi:hypothetical protein